MSKCDKIHLTEFDIATCGTGFQLIKAYLPYVDGSEQRMLAVFIRITELVRTMDFYRDLPCPSPLSRARHSPECIASELKDYCSPKEYEIFNLMSNYQKINEMMKLYSAAGSAMPGFADIFASLKEAGASSDSGAESGGGAEPGGSADGGGRASGGGVDGGADGGGADGGADSGADGGRASGGADGGSTDDVLRRFLTPAQQKLYEQYTKMLDRTKNRNL